MPVGTVAAASTHCASRQRLSSSTSPSATTLMAVLLAGSTMSSTLFVELSVRDDRTGDCTNDRAAARRRVVLGAAFIDSRTRLAVPSSRNLSPTLTWPLGASGAVRSSGSVCGHTASRKIRSALDIPMVKTTGWKMTRSANGKQERRCWLDACWLWDAK